MRNIILLASLCVLLIGLSPQSSAALVLSPALMPAAINKPLMVIRFNQNRIFYKKPLYKALSQAIEAAPAVRFNLVSYVPRPAQQGAAQNALALANAHLRDVVMQMQKMGVPRPQISINSQLDPTLKYDEVHIFVY